MKKIINQENKIYINPHIIRQNADVWNHSYRSKHKICVLGGDWDLKRENFNDRHLYIGFKQVHIDKTHKWEDTTYIKNRKWLMSRIPRWDSIYFDIKNNGWKEVGAYISINVDRDGKILFNDGQHRLTFAKFLNLKEIPVKICVIHEKFYNAHKEKLNK